MASGLNHIRVYAPFVDTRGADNTNIICTEICNNGIDKCANPDSLIDALDPNCNSCEYLGQNLITNGEFELGNTGLYLIIFIPTQIQCVQHGEYIV